MKRLIYLFFFLILCSFIYSAPPFTFQSASGNFLEVRIGDLDYIKLNTDQKFHIHLFNASSGQPYTKDARCYLHVYDINHNHIAIETTNTLNGDFDYEFSISGTNFTDIGYYPFIVQCNNSHVGGFVSGSIRSTIDGLEPNTRNLYPLIIASALIIAFFIIFAGMNDSIVFKFTGFGIAIIELLMMAGIVYAYVSGLDYLTLIRINFYSLLIITLGIGFIALIIRAMNIMNLSDENSEGNPYKKWR